MPRKDAKPENWIEFLHSSTAEYKLIAPHAVGWFELKIEAEKPELQTELAKWFVRLAKILYFRTVK